jgi:hypothetical protein
MPRGGDIEGAVSRALLADRVELERTRLLEAEHAARPSDDELEAQADGERLVDEALSAGRWTDEEARTFREVSSRMNGEHIADLVARLSTALDRNELDVSTSGPPF